MRIGAMVGSFRLGFRGGVEKAAELGIRAANQAVRLRPADEGIAFSER